MKYTFGKTKASEKLETLVDENPQASRKVSRLLSGFTNKLLHITGARDVATVLTCMELLRAQTLERVDLLENLAPDIRSYTKNVVSYRYRVYRDSFERLAPKLKQKD